MKSIKDVIAITKSYTILYAEDEDSIRDNLVPFFEKLFKKVFVAVDGLDGLEKFHKNENTIDFIISDIQMPKMDGLDMVEAIREYSKDIPIIIMTAFVEKSFFIKSIELKVDKYLLKPIIMNQTMEALYDISKLLLDRSHAKELEILQMKEKINKISDKLITELADAVPSPCIIFTGNEVRYVNGAFCTLFEEEEFKKFSQKSLTVDELFDKREGFIHSLSEYDADARNKVSIRRKKGRKIYTVLKSDIDIDRGSNLSQMYYFNDITWEEYQKIKIKNYSELLEEVIFKNRYHISPKQKIVTQVDTQETVKTDKMKISDSENALLRRSHVFKTTATEYVEELDDEILAELQELEQLGKEFQYSAKIFQEDQDIVVIDEIADYLSKYAHVINLLFEFEDLSYAIQSLSELLRSIKDKEIDDKGIKKIALFLAAIESDLADWYQLIFIEKSAQDIHYLDSSLFSACLQIELILSNDIKEMESESDDDFELF